MRNSSISLTPSVISLLAAAISPASSRSLRACRRRNIFTTTNPQRSRCRSRSLAWGFCGGRISQRRLSRVFRRKNFSLQSPSLAVKRSAAAKLRLLAKNRADNRVLIAESGAVPALVPLLRCSDPWTQEHAVTALLNLSLHEDNKILLTNAGAVKSLIHVLITGTEASKQNAACALLSLAMVEENKASIGASGAKPPLVSLLLNGSIRGKKDALPTLYKLCSVKQNKERAVSAGAVKPLVELVAEEGSGMTEKAMVVLNSVAAMEEGKEAIVEEGGIGVLVEVIEEVYEGKRVCCFHTFAAVW